jgi:uncharacterized glyoxalase superfamily metalloenzyme YdcJ
MCNQTHTGSKIAAEVIFKCITEGDNQPDQPQCVKIVDQVAKKADVDHHQARHFVAVAVEKFNAAGLRALLQDFPE